MQCLDVGVVGEGEPAFGVERRVHHRFRCLAQRLALLGVEIRVTGGGPAGEQLGSAGQGVLHVGKYIHLDAGVMQPCPVGVFPTFDGHAPVAQLLLHLCEFGIPRVQRGMLASLQLRRVQVEACVLHGHRDPCHDAAAWILQHGGRSDLRAPLHEHLGGNGELLPDLDSGSVDVVFDGRLAVQDVDASELARLLDGDRHGRCLGYECGLLGRAWLARARRFLRRRFPGGLCLIVLCFHTCHCMEFFAAEVASLYKRWKFLTNSPHCGCISGRKAAGLFVPA